MVSRAGPVDGEPHPVDATDVSEVDPQFLRQEVSYPRRLPQVAPGTIVVDINEKFLYLVQKDGRALRYGVGVGKQGYSFKGWATIRRKEKWPHWTPTANMIKLQPARYGPYASGLPGGEDNPLGPRALYLYEGDRDTMFRIHGTIEPWSIGQQVSSGCIRLLNQDIIDLYERVHRSNGGEPDAGRRLKAWAREAGFVEVATTASLWNFSDATDREWWGSMWEARVLQSAFAADATSKGLATREHLERISRAWREWADSEDGWLAMPHGEIIAQA